MRKTLILYSFAIPSLLAFALIGASVYLWSQGQPVPEDLNKMTHTALGFVFGFLPGLVKEALDNKPL
jgi:hypothetical protein